MCLVLDPIWIGTKLIEGNGAKGICSLYLPAVDYILGEYETDQHLIFPKEFDPGAVETDDVEPPVDGGKGAKSSSSSSSSSGEESTQEDSTPLPMAILPRDLTASAKRLRAWFRADVVITKGRHLDGTSGESFLKSASALDKRFKDRMDESCENEITRLAIQ